MNDREPFIYIKQMYMKGFFDLEENCKEKIISEDYWDFIIPLSVSYTHLTLPTILLV